MGRERENVKGRKMFKKIGEWKGQNLAQHWVRVAAFGMLSQGGGGLGLAMVLLMGTCPAPTLF